jgi:peptidoglycan/LPS O-acetylase OafA/YrhL
VTLADARPDDGLEVGPGAPAAPGADPDPGGTERAPQDGAPHNRLPHFPGLDGLRGVAVIVVLLFHGGFSWAVGGYLGVSTFFTLSGFLITSLLLAERTVTRTVDVPRFWLRRVRRLLPAALAGLALAVAFAHFAGTAGQQRTLAGDVVSAMADVANWHFIFSHQSYADVFSGPSPVLHFWSLAIEEQFYLVFPLLALLLLAKLRWSRSRVGQALVVLMAASLASTLFLGFSHDRIYYGTETRSFELLAGALLAVVIYSRKVTRRLARPGPRQTALAAAGAAALAVCVVLWMRTPQSADWLYRGGLSAYSGLSVLVIVATIIPFGPVAALLATRPLRRVGILSYGIYVYHWPIFLWVGALHLGLGLWGTFALEVAITWVVAVASFRFLEMPIRRGRLPFGLDHRSWVRPANLGWAIPVAFLLVGTGALLVTAAAPEAYDFAQAQHTLEHLGAGTHRVAAVKPVAVVGSSQPLPLPVAKVAAFGDSTALVVGVGINAVETTTGGVEEVDGGAWVGCGLGIGGIRRSTTQPSLIGPTPPACDAWPTTYARVIKQNQPDLALVLDAPWDVEDRKLVGDTKWRSFGDPVYDRWFFSEMVRAVDTLDAQGATVVWMTTPPVSNIPARTNRLNQLIEDLPKVRPGKVIVLDFAKYLAHTGQDAELRPDGIHLSAPAAQQVARTWLIPQLLKIWAGVYAKRLASGTTTTVGAPPATLGQAAASGSTVAPHS